MSGTTTWTYDLKDQMTQEASARNSKYTHNFGYDSAGNPTTFKGSSSTFNSNNQNTAYTFDNNGNPTTYKGTTCTYDVENRLTAYGSALTNGYRGDGLRAWKQPNGGSKTYFLYDGEVLACELDSSGNVSAVPTFGPAGLVSRRSGSTTTYMQFDPQGGLSQTTDGSGNVTASYGWDAYGSALNGSAGVYGYGAQWGYYTDAETGLQLLTYRMYDPAVGRFLTRDPIGYAGGLNLYGYVGNDPVGAADPTGLAKWIEIKRDAAAGDPWYRYYHHAYIRLTETKCLGQATFGYWPTTAGTIVSPDPDDARYPPNMKRLIIEQKDRSFEEALCICIKASRRNVPPGNKDPFNGKPFYVCGTWVEDMWECAMARTKRKDYGTAPGKPQVGPQWETDWH